MIECVQNKPTYYGIGHIWIILPKQSQTSFKIDMRNKYIFHHSKHEHTVIMTLFFLHVAVVISILEYQYY